MDPMDAAEEAVREYEADLAATKKAVGRTVRTLTRAIDGFSQAGYDLFVDFFFDVVAEVKSDVATNAANKTASEMDADDAVDFAERMITNRISYGGTETAILAILNYYGPSEGEPLLTEILIADAKIRPANTRKTRARRKRDRRRSGPVQLGLPLDE